MPRFFVSKNSIDAVNGTICIEGNDAHHISRSLRMAEGETVTVCDGEGSDYLCRLDTVRDEYSILSLLEKKVCPSEPPYRITVFQALVKGDRMDTVIQKSVEYGASSIVPFESSRCIMKRSTEDQKEQRRNRIAEEAAKQCGRGIIPYVECPVAFDTMLERASGFGLPLFCYESERRQTIKDVIAQKGLPDSVSIVVGPEGGFSAEEAEKAEKAGLISVSLGQRILRTESAAPFVLACLAFGYEL